MKMTLRMTKKAENSKSKINTEIKVEISANFRELNTKLDDIKTVLITKELRLYLSDSDS